jgi:hypothetical protein
VLELLAQFQETGSNIEDQVSVVKVRIHGKKIRGRKPRIVITPGDLKNLYAIHGTDNSGKLAKRTGLPYQLIYNIVHKRVLSVSDRHYRKLFRSEPPPQDPLKVDGVLFRAMVALWLYLNDRSSRAVLYKEFFGDHPDITVDHRIFSGKINTVDMRLEHFMRRKFSDEGVDPQLLDQWLDEFETMSYDNWVPYFRIRPVLAYLEEKLGLHPTTVLHQSVVRYETGGLKRVSRSIADRAEALKRRTEKALQRYGEKGIDKIRESIVGSKPGYTLYSDVKEELIFLNRFFRKSVKHYLGRGLWMYENGKAKRVTDWRARRIYHDCADLIHRTPTLVISSLPRSQQGSQMQKLVDVLVARSTQLLSDKEGIDFEKRILRPSFSHEEYNDPHLGFTPFEMAPKGLGMKRKAFDLMVAKHCDIFRTVGKFSKRWYLPELYLRELAGRKAFDLISAKYELLAKNPKYSKPPGTCLI